MTLRQCQVFFLIYCAEIISHAPAGFPLRFPRLCDKIILFAGMVELADTLDLGSNGIAVQVQVLLPAPNKHGSYDAEIADATVLFTHKLKRVGYV